MYKNDGDGDIEIDKMPSAGYVINEEKSYCYTADPNTHSTGIRLYTKETGEHVIANLNKNDKCYIYFDLKHLLSGGEAILANLTIRNRSQSFTTIATTDEGVYKAQDDDGDTYYWRGAVTNNHVKFAGLCWKVIRINGDGSIRMIYDGDATRETTSIGISKFNINDNDNAYVGFKFERSRLHGIALNSTVLTKLDTWYNDNLKNYADKIDLNAGFCNDREPSTSNTTSNGMGGLGTRATYYGAYNRFRVGEGWKTTQAPTFKCKNSSDLFTTAVATKGNKSLTNPIGLITADEVIFGGGFGGVNNSTYYLYTSQNYWTMSPFSAGGNARIFIVGSDGQLTPNLVPATASIRPVINLRADTKFSGTGLESDPFVVV